MRHYTPRQPKKESENRPALPYITWGHVWDLKIESEISKNKNGFTKNRKEAILIVKKEK